MRLECDVAIIGGGPGGATVGTLLKKYNPRLDVRIFEREVLPRDHVGESQLPLISQVLDEMEVWDKVEAAGFPVKIGATYRWGRTDDLWDFEFLPNGNFQEQARPAKYSGQRVRTAFQVDRSIYDKILLDHAAEFGCRVRQGTAVREVVVQEGSVRQLVLDDGTEVLARHYIDASGHAGLLRRTLGVEIDCPSSLQNIAIWDYWRNAEWAVSVGVGGTRVQVLSLPYGWIWFIPLGPDRTSIGLITPAKYYKEQPKSPEELYLESVQSDPIVSKLLRNATRENKLSTTKDWSFVANRLTGPNWFLVGESAGFADPILAAGLTLTHVGARDVAYTILALDRGDYEPDWLRRYYCETHRFQIRQHIRFADFWYTANGVFSDLKDFAAKIATDAGLTLTSEDAWRWLGQGGFIERNSGTDVGLYGLLITKEFLANFTGGDPHYDIAGKTHFNTNLEGAEKDWVAEFSNGRITRYRAYRRSGKLLPMRDLCGHLARELATERSVAEIGQIGLGFARQNRITESGFQQYWTDFIKTLEVLVADGWIDTRIEAGAEPMPRPEVDFSPTLHPNRGVGSLKVDS
jgi:flavin-dependent dehydrogenase